MASIVLISATSRSSGIQAFEANHLVSSYLWFSPLPFRWQQFECEKLEFPGIYKSIIKLANHPTLLQPNLPHSGVVSNIQNLLHKRVELNYPFHARFVVTESNLASRRMIQDLMTALLSSLSAGCSCAIWNFRRTVRSGDITTGATGGEVAQGRNGQELTCPASEPMRILGILRMVSEQKMVK